MDPWGVADLTTDGAGELTVGPVEVVSERGSQSQLEGTEVFESLGAFVSVSSSELVDTQQVFVSVNSKESTGLAIYNPNPEAVTLKLVLADGSGIIQATIDLNLDAKQQMARFVNEAELFKDYFDARGEPFSDTLNLYLEDGRGFAVIGLLLDRATNGLIAVSASSRAIPD